MCNCLLLERSSNEDRSAGTATYSVEALKVSLGNDKSFTGGEIPDLTSRD